MIYLWGSRAPCNGRATSASLPPLGPFFFPLFCVPPFFGFLLLLLLLWKEDCLAAPKGIGCVLFLFDWTASTSGIVNFRVISRGTRAS